MQINPEKSTDYLTRVNWKSLVEYLTAEVILNRPVDPLQYCRDILGVKLTERGGSDFRPEVRAISFLYYFSFLVYIISVIK